MKKNIFLFLLILTFGLFTSNVKAASIPYDWVLSDGKSAIREEIPGATITKDSTTVTLTLNNYNGGSLEESLYGSGVVGVTFNVVLVGDNYITSNDTGIKLEYTNGKINFSGEGTLTINSPKPISYENYSNYLYISPSKSIYTDKVETNKTITETKDNLEQKDEIITEDEDNLEETSKSEESVNLLSNSEKKDNELNLILVYSFIGYVIISLMVIIGLTIKNKKICKK